MSKITLKKSSVVGKVPVVGDLDFGEIAINYADGILYYKNSAGSIGVLNPISTSVSSFNTRTGAITLTSGDVTTALGFTPYNATNPSGYISGNQTITFSGDASGSGATAVTLTLANSGATAGTYRSVTVDAKGRVTAGTNPTTLAGYGITDAQPLDGDLTAIAGLAGTTGFLKKTAANTWALDTNTYLTGNQSIIVSGDASGTGTTAISLTLANSGVTAGTYNNSATAVTPLTLDAKGRVTATGTAVTITPAWSSITSKPTTISGFGITDAYTKTEVDGFLQGLDPKSSVRAATTANITLSAAQTIDGVAVVAGDRVLVKDQTTASQNGIYVVASGAWTRATDLNIWAEFPGAYVFVEEGTANQDFGFVCTNNQTGTLETTSVTWVQFNGAANITAGTGLAKSGNTLSIANTAVTAAAYGSASSVGTFTVNQQGQLTAAGSTAIAITSNQVSGLAASATTDTTNAGNILTGILNAGRMPAFTGDATSSQGTSLLTLANSGVVAGTYTKVTVDAKGRVTTGATLASADLPTYTGTLTSSQITTGLGFTPYNSTNPSGYITSSALSSYLPLTGGTLTTTNSTGSLVISDTGTSGANIKLTGSGATTPSKTIRAFSGNFSIVNNAYSAEIFTLSDAGVISNSTWNGAVVNSTYGGTGVNNAGRTLTVNTNSGTLTFTNASTTLTIANTASVSGTNTGDQTITLTGDVTGSGTGSFATTLANSGVTAGTYRSVTVDAKGRVTGGTNPTTLAGYGITDAQPLDSDLTAIAALTPTLDNFIVGSGTSWILETPAQARASLGGTTAGQNLFTVANPSAVTFLRINADNTVSTLDAATFRTAIGAGTSSTTGTVTSVSGTGSYGGLTLTGTVTSSGSLTLGGTPTGTWPISVSGNSATVTNGVYTTNNLLLSRGSVADTALDTTTTTGIYLVSYTGSSRNMLVWNTGGSTGIVQFEVNYGNTGEIRLRNQTDSTTWSSWRTFLTNQNYNSYSPTLTGTGASGTWGISITGSAATLTTSRTIGMTGDVTWTSASFNGSANVTGTATLANSGVVAGTYTKVTVDAKGRVTTGTTLASADLPTYTGTLTSSQVTTALGFTPMNVYNGASAASYDTLTTNGVWRNQGGLNGPSGTTHTTLLTALQGDANYGWQLSSTGSTLYVRDKSTTWTSWRTLIDSTNYNSYAPTLTGTGASGTWGISITGSSASTTGNAATATTLQTARNINGTSFNGSANITTASWGTARTLTIGSTGKSVDGSGNVSWTVAEIGAVGSGNTMTINAEYSGTVAQNQTGWYTIASYGSGRAEATFHLSDQDSSRHNYVRANIVWSFGYGGIVVDTSGRHGVSTIRNIRLLYNTSDRTYGGVKVQVYCEGTSDQAWTLRVRQETTTTTGWGNFTEVTPVLEGTPAGWAEGCQAYYVNEQGQISTSSSSAYFAGNLALHAGNYSSYALPLGGGTVTGAVSMTADAQGYASPTLYVRGDIRAQRGTGGSGVIYFGNSSGTYLYYDGANYFMPNGQLDVNGSRVLNAANYTSYSPSLTGSGASGTWGISITGNAATATTLQTARTINGVSFNGSANISVNLNNSLTFNNSGSGAASGSTFNGSGAATISYNTIGAPSTTGTNASGTWGISITGYSYGTSVLDSDRNLGNRLPTSTGQSVRFDFANATATGTGGNYAGVMTFSPWSGTTASTGDASYQLAFGSTATNGGGNPQLRIRKGIDSTWNSWIDLLTSANFSSYALPLSGGTLSGDITFSNGRKGLVGVYDASQTQAIFAMGPSYVLTNGGASGTYGNFYGLGWSYNPDYGGAGNNPQSKPNLGHQLLLMMAGTTRTAIGTGIWTDGTITATGNVTAYSDERLKKDWSFLPPDFVERLAKVKSGTYSRIDEDMRQVGVSAQSLQDLLPEAVLEGEYLSVAYGNAALAASVELAKRVVQQDQKIAELTALVQKLLNKE